MFISPPCVPHAQEFVVPHEVGPVPWGVDPGRHGLAHVGLARRHVLGDALPGESGAADAVAGARTVGACELNDIIVNTRSHRLTKKKSNKKQLKIWWKTEFSPSSKQKGQFLLLIVRIVKSKKHEDVGQSRFPHPCARGSCCWPCRWSAPALHC